MHLSRQKRAELIEAALGKRQLDTVVENIQLVSVFTGEIYEARVGIYDGYIAHVESDPDGTGKKDEPTMRGKDTLDGGGMYLLPGFIDAHVHIESSMMTPPNFAEVVIPHGTTTVITDPHEIGNVLGVEGVRYMVWSSEQLPMRQYLLVPSCVPSVPGLETTGAEFGAEEVAEMLQWDRVLGLAEVMDFPGVIHGSERMRDVVHEALTRGRFIQGHSPSLSGRALSAYLCAGPQSDHEITDAAEAREKMRLGMTVDARESSMARNMAEVISAVGEFMSPPNLSICTDDREPSDLLHEGHMNHAVRRAIAEGLDASMAVRAATLNTARVVGIDVLGAVAPGYAADLLLVPSLEEMKPALVMTDGEVVAEDGEMVVPIDPAHTQVEQKNTVYLDLLSEEDIAIRAPVNDGTVQTRILTYSEDDLLYAALDKEQLPVDSGLVDISKSEDLCYVGVFNRHGAPENRFVGVIRNFGLRYGAIASTISHDCHNLTVVASNAEDAVIAANSLIECGGGIACTRDGEVIDVLKLPIAGLMSSLPVSELAPRATQLKGTLTDMGIPGEDPLLRIATLTLAVIPEGKITDQGLVEVNKQKLVALFPE